MALPTARSEAEARLVVERPRSVRGGTGALHAGAIEAEVRELRAVRSRFSF